MHVLGLTRPAPRRLVLLLVGWALVVAVDLSSKALGRMTEGWITNAASVPPWVPVLSSLAAFAVLAVPSRTLAIGLVLAVGGQWANALDHLRGPVLDWILVPAPLPGADDTMCNLADVAIALGLVLVVAGIAPGLLRLARGRPA